MKRIVISGANGFLGSHIIRKALEGDDFSILAISKRQNPYPGLNDISFLDTDTFFSQGFIAMPNDIFINCLFPTNADGYKMANGINAVFNTISTAKKAGIERFINISSQSVYNSKRLVPASETDALCIDTPYAVGKFCSECFTNEMFRDSIYTNVRLSSLLGVDYSQRIVNRMIENALETGKLRVIGGLQRYGFLDVRDASSGILCLVENIDKVNLKSVYNLGRIDSYSLVEIAKLISERIGIILGKQIEIQIEDGNDLRNSSVDVSRFRRDFEWEPHYSLASTVDDIIMSINDKRKR